MYHQDVNGEMVGLREELVVGIGEVCRNVSVVAELTPILAHDQCCMITVLALMEVTVIHPHPWINTFQFSKLFFSSFSTCSQLFIIFWYNYIMVKEKHLIINELSFNCVCYICASRSSNFHGLSVGRIPIPAWKFIFERHSNSGDLSHVTNF